jgi:hypothetical protein
MSGILELDQYGKLWPLEITNPEPGTDPFGFHTDGQPKSYIAGCPVDYGRFSQDADLRI